jgi:predicted Zn-dependent peptidase
LNYKEHQRELLKSLDTNELNNLAKKLWNKDRFSIVVVGDKKLILDKLNQIGLPIVELDTNGNPVK